MNIPSLDFSRLALGTVQFGLDYGISNTIGKTKDEEVRKILDAALTTGINTLDTASSYGDSEKIIGNYNSQAFNIISKFPCTVQSAEDLKVSFELSLLNLKTSFLYGYLAHDADMLLKYPGLWQSLEEIKNKGSIKKIGFSLYRPQQLEQLLAMNYIPCIVQVPYNFIDRRFEKYFLQLKSLGCEIHVRTAFLQGLFFFDPDKLSSFFDGVKPLLLQLRQHFPGNEQIAAFLMKFVLSNMSVDKLVFGVNTKAQFQENIDSLQLNTEKLHIDWNEDLPEEILMPDKWPKQFFINESVFSQSR